MAGADEQVEEFPDLVICLGGVAHRYIAVDDVVIASPDSLHPEVPGSGQVGDYPLYRSLGDSDRGSDVAEPGVRFTHEADEDLGVVGKVSPRLVSVAPLSPLDIDDLTVRLT